MRPERLDVSKKRAFDNLEGRQFGEITILYPIKTPDHVSKTNLNQYYWASCSCGKEYAISCRTIKRHTGGRTGARACSECSFKKGGEKRTSHGLSQDRIYRIWASMKGRAGESGSLSYGARGITVCEEWNREGEEGFLSFYNWSMENNYQDGLSLDRIDVNGPYAPNNCQWVTPKEQNYNKRNSLYIEVNGEKVSLSQYYYSEPGRIIPYRVASGRFRHGWSLEEIFTTPLGQRRDGKGSVLKKEKIKTPILKPKPIAITNNRKDWTGAQRGKIKILYPIAPPDYIKSKSSGQFFWARCSCGKEYPISHNTIMKNVRACKGCTMKEVGKMYHKPNRIIRKKLNKIWLDVNGRCGSNHLEYGARGISVYEDWSHSFESFYEWSLANGYEKGLTLERKDVNGNYEPSNCIWIPKEEQAYNKRNTVYVEYQGERISLAKLRKKLNCDIPYHTIYSRYNRRWSVERIFSTLVNKKR